MPRFCLGVAGLLVLLALPGLARAKTELGVDGTGFTINGQPTFLLGISYYGALGASDDFIERDLADMGRDGFRWIRVWATWASGDTDVSAVEDDGSPRQPYLARLVKLVELCDKHGIVVDVTLCRQGGGVSTPRLATAQQHRRAVETLVGALRPYRNWYLDLANERNIGDKRFVDYQTLKMLRDRAKELDPNCLITASHSSDEDDFVRQLDQYLNTVGVDFVAQHRGRYAASPGETEAATRRYLDQMRKLGRTVPIHYQEPFRRAYGGWQPVAADYVADLRGAIRGGAAGWCFHNGSDRGDARPPRGRSFDLRNQRLYDQLDEVERAAIGQLKAVLSEERPDDAR